MNIKDEVAKINAKQAKDSLAFAKWQDNVIDKNDKTSIEDVQYFVDSLLTKVGDLESDILREAAAKELDK